jgi:SAM-dependent methyltransferase
VDEQAAWNEGASAWVERVREGLSHPHDASIRDLLPPPAGLTLDVGCGEGRLTRDLRALGYDVVGFDRSEALVEEARRADPDGRYDIAEIEALPVGDGEAQLLLCVNVLPHVVELEPAVRELARVLGGGATAVVGLLHPVAVAGTYDDDADELRLSGYFDQEAHGVPLGDHHVFHQHRTIEQYVRAFLAAGFVLADLREVPGRTGQAPLYLDLRLTRE